MKLRIFALGPMQTNCYFLVDEATDKTVIVDPACDANGIADKLKRHGCKPEAVVLTHAHFDHMLALDELRERFDIPLFVHEGDAPAVIDPSLSMMDLYADVHTGCKPAERLLKDGDEISFGNTTLKVIHTPGHTPGSICLTEGDTMISGDTLFKESIGRYDFPGGDYKTLMKSLEKLLSLETDYNVYPGHGPKTTLSHEREFNYFIH